MYIENLMSKIIWSSLSLILFIVGISMVALAGTGRQVVIGTVLAGGALIPLGLGILWKD